VGKTSPLVLFVEIHYLPNAQESLQLVEHIELEKQNNDPLTRIKCRLRAKPWFHLEL